MNKKHKTHTGSIPSGVGFPGTNLVRPRLHPAIQHINASSEALSNPKFILAVNNLVDKVIEVLPKKKVHK